jgi:hypothetical protein
MKSILSRYAIAAIVPALLIAAAPVTAKPVPKAPTIVKARDAIAQSNPKNKAPKKNAKIEAMRQAISEYYAKLNNRLEPGEAENFGSGGFSFFEVTMLQLRALNGNKAEVQAMVIDRGYVGYGRGSRGSRRMSYDEGGTVIIRDVVLNLEKQGNTWKVESTREISSQMVGGQKIIH